MCWHLRSRDLATMIWRAGCVSFPVDHFRVSGVPARSHWPLAGGSSQPIKDGIGLDSSGRANTYHPSHTCDKSLKEFAKNGED